MKKYNITNHIKLEFSKNEFNNLKKLATLKSNFTPENYKENYAKLGKYINQLSEKANIHIPQHTRSNVKIIEELHYKYHNYQFSNLKLSNTKMRVNFKRLLKHVAASEKALKLYAGKEPEMLAQMIINRLMSRNRKFLYNYEKIIIQALPSEIREPLKRHVERMIGEVSWIPNWK